MIGPRPYDDILPLTDIGGTGTVIPLKYRLCHASPLRKNVEPKDHRLLRCQPDGVNDVVPELPLDLPDELFVPLTAADALVLDGVPCMADGDEDAPATVVLQIRLMMSVPLN